MHTDQDKHISSINGREHQNEPSRHYKAFISYSHKDARWARWLTRRLETYRPPKSLSNAVGSNIKTPLSPIFRDREELSVAHSLGERIKTALANSEYLIVLCSPASAKSKWVNQEIAEFTRLHGPEKILAVIIDGQPFASINDDLDASQECFPENLRFHLTGEGELTARQAEPCAADLRRQGDGKALGFLKLAAGMLNVRLDSLVRRDQVRRTRTVTAVTAIAFAGMLLTSTLAYLAIQGQHEARKQTAEVEGLIEFMLTELRTQLEPVGRLDILQSVANEVNSYFDRNTGKDATSLLKLARTKRFLGDLASASGMIEQSKAYYDESTLILEQIKNDEAGSLRFAQNYGENIIALGTYFWSIKNFDEAKKYIDLYKNYAEEKHQLYPQDDEIYLMVAEANAVDGIYHLQVSKRYALAIEQFTKALDAYRNIEKRKSTISEKNEIRRLISDRLIGVADAYEKLGKLADALKIREQAFEIHNEILTSENFVDWRIKNDSALNIFAISILHKKMQDLNSYIQKLSTAYEIITEVKDHDPQNIIYMAYFERIEAEFLKMKSQKSTQQGE